MQRQGICGEAMGELHNKGDGGVDTFLLGGKEQNKPGEHEPLQNIRHALRLDNDKSVVVENHVVWTSASLGFCTIIQRISRCRIFYFHRVNASNPVFDDHDPNARGLPHRES